MVVYGGDFPAVAGRTEELGLEFDFKTGRSIFTIMEYRHLCSLKQYLPLSECHIRK